MFAFSLIPALFLLCWYLRNAGLEVDSGQQRVISSVVLEAEDLDTLPHKVFYFLNAEPRFGNLQLKVRDRFLVRLTVQQ